MWGAAVGGQVGGGGHLHDAGHLLGLALPGEQGPPGVELGQDAAQAPHVDGHAVRLAKDHLGGAVEPALNVGVHCREGER